MKRYYKTCLLSPLWLPIVLGLVAFGLTSLFPGCAETFPHWMVFSAWILVCSIPFGGLQYCIALYLVWTRIDFECTRSWVVGALWLPVIFTPIQIVGLLLFTFPSVDRWEDLRAYAMLAAYDLVLGYAYVLLWFAGLGLIRVVQLFRKEAVL